MRVVYSEQMNAPAQGYSPSAAKPAAVVTAWQAQWPQLQGRVPVPVSRAGLCRAHDSDFVDGLLSLLLPNGFGTHRNYQGSRPADGMVRRGSAPGVSGGMASVTSNSGRYLPHYQRGLPSSTQVTVVSSVRQPRQT